MIKRSILFFVFLVVCWTAFTRYVFKKDSSLHQWQDNTIAGEKYLYADSGIQNVMVGTSLSGHIIQDSIPEIYKLTFAGLSIYDGLNIILRKKVLPKNVFIETNKIFAPENADLRDALFSPLAFYSKKYITGLRSNKEPLSMAGTYIDSRMLEFLYYRLLFRIDDLTYRVGNQNSQRNVREEVFFAKMIEMKKKDYTRYIPPQTISTTLNKLKTYVSRLKENGINVIFFEMPINKDLVDLPNNIAIRDSIYKTFPASQFNYIYLPPDYNKYETGDGVHLTSAESEIYSGYFKNEANKLLNKLLK